MGKLNPSYYLGLKEKTLKLADDLQAVADGQMKVHEFKKQYHHVEQLDRNHIEQGDVFKLLGYDKKKLLSELRKQMTPLEKLLTDVFESELYLKDDHEKDVYSYIRGLTSLTKTELFVITEKYGLTGQTPRSLISISKELNVSDSRVGQVYHTAIRKLRQPSIKRVLDESVCYYDGVKEADHYIRREIEDLKQKNKVLKNDLEAHIRLLVALRKKYPLDNLGKLTEPIERLRLPKKLYHAAKRADIKIVGELAYKSDKEISRIRGIGIKGAKEIKESIEKYLT